MNKEAEPLKPRLFSFLSFLRKISSPIRWLKTEYLSICIPRSSLYYGDRRMWRMSGIILRMSSRGSIFKTHRWIILASRVSLVQLRGNVKENRLPSPGWLAATSAPPCACTMPRAIVSPRPAPLPSRARDFSLR